MQSKKISFNPEKFDIYPLVINVFALLEINAFHKTIDLDCKVEHGTYVYVDKNAIASVLRNLIDNAIKFTPEGGKIVVSSKKINNFVEVSVTDTGLGISSEDIEKIFSSDINFTTIGTHNEKGSGLGLLLCKEFVEKNGGTIEVTGKPEKGSVFKFTIPFTVAHPLDVAGNSKTN
jgi:signal transduction histidine kinase